MTRHLGSDLSGFIDGTLAPDELRRALDHVDGCDECRRSAVAERAVRERLAVLGAPSPTEGLLARLAAIPASDVADAQPARSMVRSRLASPGWPTAPFRLDDRRSRVGAAAVGAAAVVTGAIVVTLMADGTGQLAPTLLQDPPIVERFSIEPTTAVDVEVRSTATPVPAGSWERDG